MDLITVAIAVSRVEAAVVAGMLEGYGIRVHVGGYAQGTLEFNSVALGGYRLWVSEADWSVASDILRQSAVNDHDSLSTGPRQAIIRFLLVWLGAHAAIIAPALPAILVSAPWAIAALFAFQGIIPVNPQGRADYYLAPPSEG
jgi:hypothetical protein